MRYENEDSLYNGKFLRECPQYSYNEENADYTSSEEYQFRYESISCIYCCHKNGCPFAICPRIMENLDGLMNDRAFIKAIKTAESCRNGHRETLIMLKEDRGDDLNY